MDYDRDEALRTKEAAERKFNAKDLTGARKFALMAQNLFPNLEGICQMISTLDIHLAAERKVNGENDWYAILSVDASANEEILKKRYRKLVLQLHPDKNKSVGAEGAFKLISQAWSVLSDKSRKLEYDQKRNVNGFQHGAPKSHEDHSVQSSANGFYEFAQVRKKSKRARKNHTDLSAVPPSHSSTLNTFWTSCDRCRMQYEYLRVYLNHNLLCPNCNQAFLAVEIGIPVNAVNSSVSWSAKQCQQNSSHNSTIRNGYCPGYSNSTFQGTSPAEFQHVGDPYNNQFHWEPYAGSSGINSTTDTAFQAAKFTYTKVNKKRKKREEVQLGARRTETHRSDDFASRNASNGFTSDSKFTHTYEQDYLSFKPEKPSKIMRHNSDAFVDYERNETENFSACTESATAFEVEKTISASADYPKSRVTRQYNFSKELLQINVRQLLVEKVRVTISKKLEEWGLANPSKSGEKVKSNQKHDQKDNDSELEGAAVHVKELMQTELDDYSTKNSPDSDDIGVLQEVHKPISIDVPDPDFYDFDKDRLERTFEGDQVWATYDSEDGMPRLYVLVQKVLSLKPFRIRMTFLTSKSNSELGPINWVGSGYAKTCGDFRVGRYKIWETINIFSHRMRWEKGPRGVIKILPKKGDIWAVYKNWSPDWNEFTPDDIIHKYEMVEVLDDYFEEQGVVVAPLVKVAGFKAVFHRHLDTKEVKRIPREEMFRFSHQVPYYMLTGEETHNALKGCLELDPAATPVELLQVITEVKDDVGEETGELKVQS